MDELIERYSKLSDNELLIMVYFENSNYTKEAIEIAKAILNERGLGSPSDDILHQAKNHKTQIEESEMKVKYKGIRGWLLLFVLSLMFFSPIQTIGTIVQEGVTNLETIFIMFITCFGMYVGYALWTKRPNAVKVTKIYLITMLTLSVILISICLITDIVLELSVLTSFVSILIWTVYIYRSKRVKATYGDWEIMRKKQLRGEGVAS